ncbi:protein SPA2, partial [Lecanoromycetidae sp. Uapishka_2]
MNGRSGPLSHPSSNGSEWSGVSQYQYSGPHAPYSPSLPHPRGNLVTPPISGSSNGTQPRMSNGMNRRPGEPSPPNSIARSSYGTTMSSTEQQRRKTLQMEERLAQHYAILKRFLAQSLRDEKGNAKTNRARDKLLRLSAVQFQELSTDVYDELLRRQSSSGQQMNGPGQVPPYLLPKENFHPKRNQARQKLATLPPARFQDLATDVFYELERRFPIFAGRDLSRVGSPAIGPPSRAGTPNGTRNNYGARNASLGSQVMAGLGIPGIEEGRPQPKTFQSSTIVPNKSTMVEDDDDDASDIYGSRRNTTFTSRSTGGSEKDRKLADFETQVGEYESKVGELQEKVKSLEDQLRYKGLEMEKIHGSYNDDRNTQNQEREKWKILQSSLEGKLAEARNLNDSLKTELHKIRSDQADTERDMQSQMDHLQGQANDGGEWKSRYDSLDKAHQELRTQLLRQEKVTSEVKQEATGFLQQMKALSERSNQSVDKEESLIHQVHRLEKELQDWKSRYARTKSQVRHLRPSSMVNTVQPVDAGAMSREDLFSAQNGLLKDAHVTEFQVAIDELLQSARGNEPDAVLGNVKHVVIAVRKIILDMGDTQAAKDEGAQERHKSTMKLSATANNLITAAKNFVISKGLSPVSLLDAAASHVSTALVELIRLVKICPSPVDEMNDDDENSMIADSPADYYGIPQSRASAGDNSVYSSMSSPRPSQLPSTKMQAPKSVPNGMLSSASYSAPPRPSNGTHAAPDRRIEDLKNFLESRTDSLIPSIQSLVSSIRTNAEPPDILDHLAAIASTTSQIINKTAQDADDNDKRVNSILQSLSESRDRLEDAGREGEEIGNDKDWNAFVKGLPPLAFAIAKGTKELGSWVESLSGDGFS